ncbi:hypothetical protein B566_EDAN013882 [Ephemera danica]|nr:hypothetical protein B566_EDAN013882 [Ephemera danica]
MEPRSSSDEEVEEYDAESDTDLQEAFAKGVIKPGLVIPAAPTWLTPKKNFVNRTDALKRKLDEIKFKAPWIERLDLTNSLAPLAPELIEKMEEQKQHAQKAAAKGISLDTASNDFERELGFYRQAQAAVLEGLPRLQSMGIPTRRPEDYLAEMAKTDEHMQKVRNVLTKKKVEEERREKVRQFRQLKKFGKKVQAESRVAKAQQKKAILDEVKKFRKGQRKDLDFLDDDDAGTKQPAKKKRKLDYDPEQGSQQSKGKIKRSQMRRQNKDQKYGQGGKKRNKNRNTRESASDVFGQGGGKKGGGGRPGKKGAQNKQMRPGKSKRQKIKAKGKKK